MLIATNYRIRNRRPRYQRVIIEHSQFETGTKQPKNRFIDLSFGNQPFFQSFIQSPIRTAALQICSGYNRICRCICRRSVSLMSAFCIKIGNSSAIGNDNIIESPLVFQYIYQQSLIRTTRFSFKTVIGAHYFFHFSFCNKRLKSRQISFS